MKPTEAERQAAKAAIEKMREEGDSEHVAKLMHYLEYKSELLENVWLHAQRYVQFGMDEHEHTALVKAVERMREFNAKQAGEEVEKIGLG